MLLDYERAKWKAVLVSDFNKIGLFHELSVFSKPMDLVPAALCDAVRLNGPLGDLTLAGIVSDSFAHTLSRPTSLQ